MLKLEKIGPVHWEFVYPVEFERTWDNYDKAVDLLMIGRLKEAEKELKRILRHLPDHLDALHHLAIIKEQMGDTESAFYIWGQAIRLGKKAFPDKFKLGRDRLEWGFLNNRPFLRCMHAYGLSLLERGNKKEALSIFEEILLLNPNDNQGVRELVVDLYFSFQQPEKVLEICRLYPDDIIPGVLYGRPLALFQLNRKEEATEHLEKAVKLSPLIARELLKKKHKRPLIHPDMVTVGGEDEAYLYWEGSRNFWNGTPGAIEWLKEVYNNTKKCKEDF
ncbi:MAG TPA: hypothetical protein PLQ41_01690 [bacterium]|nr:hypothetical protein [bacterium]HPP29957.1 hypothetical protein [bacterium]